MKKIIKNIIKNIIRNLSKLCAIVYPMLHILHINNLLGDKVTILSSGLIIIYSILAVAVIEWAWSDM